MLEDKVVLITGAAEGMGESHARVCAGYGAIVDGLGRPGQKGEAVAQSIRDGGGQASFYQLNVTSPDNWKSVIDSILKEHGRLDGLVNNAGIVLSKPVEEITEAELDLCINVNFKGTFFGCQFALPGFKAAGGGAIVNISSTSGIVANLPGLSAYCATKGAVRLFTKAIALDYAGYGVRANSVHPGTIETPMVAEYLADKSTEELLANAAILKRVGKPS